MPVCGLLLQGGLIVDIGQYTVAVEGQRQSLLGNFLVARLLAEDVVPGIATEGIGHHRRTQRIGNLLLRHTNADF